MKNTIPWNKFLYFNLYMLVFLLLSPVVNAKAVKLGRLSLENTHFDNKGLFGAQTKEKFACVRTKDCPTGHKCKEQVCVDKCVDMTWPAGKQCSLGVISNCARGEKCNCSGVTYADGAGGCFDPCSPNPCTSTTPACTRNGANYTCSCTSNSCAGGNSCNGSTCEPCNTGAACGCSSPSTANGYGGCVDLCSLAGCSGSTPECALSGGSATCRCTSTSCPAGQKCDGTNCVNCPSGATNCGCPFGEIADGRGGCEVEDLCKNVTCPGQNRCDQSTGTCVEITCPADKKGWSAATGCVECTSNSQCADFQACKNYKCVLGVGRCYTNNDCLSKDKCVSNSCVPVCSDTPCSAEEPHCSANSSYPNQPICTCKTSENTCTGGNTCTWMSKTEHPYGYYCKAPATTCTEDSTCAYYEKCIGGKCQDACVDNTCPSDKPYCSTGYHKYTCEQCTLDSHCSAGKVCASNVCKDALCTPSSCAGQNGSLCREGTSSYSCVCYTKSDCLSGYGCPLSTCVPLNCTQDSDCGVGTKCQIGSYQNTCVEDITCTGVVCSDPQKPKCIVSSNKTSCVCTSSPNSCGDEYICEGGSCKTQTTEPCPLGTDEECPNGKKCINKFCVFK